LFLKNDSAEALKLAEKVEAVLARNNCQSVRLDRNPQMDGLDLVFVFGGDGTLLYAAKLVGERGIPILGVKIGGLGFLTEVKEQELFDMIEKAVCANLPHEDRMLMKAEIAGREKYIALNDFVIGKAIFTQMIEIDVNINGFEVACIRADGMIISSPTGSTAYCMAANGPIVHPSVQALILVPICAHSLTLRPLVIPADSIITIKVNTKGGDTHLIADGRMGAKINDSDVIKITRAEKPLRLIVSPTMNYYEILRAKLGWGLR